MACTSATWCCSPSRSCPAFKCVVKRARGIPFQRTSISKSVLAKIGKGWFSAWITGRRTSQCSSTDEEVQESGDLDENIFICVDRDVRYNVHIPNCGNMVLKMTNKREHATFILVTREGRKG